MKKNNEGRMRNIIKVILTNLIIFSLLFSNSFAVEQEKFNGGGGKSKNLMSTLTMTSISIIASRLIKYGKVTPDILAAAAGGALYIAGDIAATKRLKDATKKIEETIARDFKSGDVYDAQRQHLIQLKEMYQKAKDAAKTKKELQTAAALAFAIAAGIAYAQDAVLITAATTCGTLSQPAGAVILNMRMEDSWPKLSCEKVKAELKRVETLNTTAAATEPVAAAPAAIAACNNYVGARETAEVGSCGVQALMLVGLGSMFIYLGYYEAPVITLLTSLSEYLMNYVDSWIFLPQNRVYLWGALAGMAYTAISATDDESNKIEDNIRKIDAILDPISAQSYATAAANASVKNQNGKSSLGITGGNSEIVATDYTGVEIPCAMADTKDPVKCPSFEDKMNKALADSNMTLPAGLLQPVKALAKVMSGGNTKPAFLSLAVKDINGHANAINSFLKKMKDDPAMKSINAAIPDSEKKMNATLKDNFAAAMKKANLTEEKLASYSRGIGEMPMIASKAPETKKVEENLPDIRPIAMPAASVGIGKSEVEASNETDKKNPTSMDDYDTKHDIATDENANLFELISGRYYKSGFQHLGRLE
jgi:hypothetical protein